MEQVAWTTEMNDALSKVKAQKKPILLDFFNPGCIGCQQMDAVTYPDDKVVEFINVKLIPLRVKSDSMPYSKDFNVTWTPTLITLDQDEKERRREIQKHIGLQAAQGCMREAADRLSRE